MRGAAWLALAVAMPAGASHPLLTEDTDVLGKGLRELELHGERLRHGRDAELILKLGYGVADPVDVELELPYLREVSDGAAVEGRGDAGVSVKWRFYERQALSLAFKPELFLPSGRDEAGLGAGRVRWALNLAGAYELGRLELLAHLGYTRNRNRIGELDSLRHQSVAARVAATEKLKLVADLSWDSAAEPGGARTRELVTGASYELGSRIELGAGLKTGLNDAADDRALRAGIKLRW